MMADATGEPSLGHQTLFKTLLRRACERKPDEREAGVVQAMGSMQKKQKTQKAKPETVGSPERVDLSAA